MNVIEAISTPKMNAIAIPKSYRIRSHSSPTDLRRNVVAYHRKTDSTKSLSIGDRIRKMSKVAIKYDQHILKEKNSMDRQAKQRTNELTKIMTKQTLLVFIAILSSFMFNIY